MDDDTLDDMPWQPEGPEDYYAGDDGMTEDEAAAFDRWVDEQEQAWEARRPDEDPFL